MNALGVEVTLDKSLKPDAQHLFDEPRIGAVGREASRSDCEGVCRRDVQSLGGDWCVVLLCLVGHQRRETWEERERLKRQFEAEERRRERQRTLFTMLTPGRNTDALKAAMLERAKDLITAGKTEPADAILEFLPSADAQRLLDELFPEEKLSP